ncbi:MAG: hypothetical protein J7601_07600 [Chloroflexi bacterium]|jgi:hypothetical protein|nr:hypothetical protein [Chloroflexota bacterium]
MQTASAVINRFVHVNHDERIGVNVTRSALLRGRVLPAGATTCALIAGYSHRMASMGYWPVVEVLSVIGLKRHRAQ